MEAGLSLALIAGHDRAGGEEAWGGRRCLLQDVGLERELGSGPPCAFLGPRCRPGQPQARVDEVTAVLGEAQPLPLMVEEELRIKHLEIDPVLVLPVLRDAKV